MKDTMKIIEVDGIEQSRVKDRAKSKGRDDDTGHAGGGGVFLLCDRSVLSSFFLSFYLFTFIVLLSLRFVKRNIIGFYFSRHQFHSY
tara:strand:- start:259 stop:519 length:261 start_codon:yes stop_codon:yes gene_type:complete